MFVSLSTHVFVNIRPHDIAKIQNISYNGLDLMKRHHLVDLFDYLLLEI